MPFDTLSNTENPSTYTADFTIDRMDLILQPTEIPIKTRFSLLIFK